MSDLLTQKLIAGDRLALSRCITLAESSREDDQALFQEILSKVLEKTGQSIRIGITGAPGVGKSTFIDKFGMHLIEQGKKVAVLTIDPGSPISKGSILGDKTRMELLAKESTAFIRPSPAVNFFGGISHSTREAILLCEAAGFDRIIVETIGVGQSEFLVKEMTDCFVLIMTPGAGDELQGIKKGIMEMADILIVNKSDGDGAKQAQKTQSEFQHALHLISSSGDRKADVILCSALNNVGVEVAANQIDQFIEQFKKNGAFDKNRNRQVESWLNEQLNYLLRKKFLGKIDNNGWQDALWKIRTNELTVFQAAQVLLSVS